MLDTWNMDSHLAIIFTCKTCDERPASLWHNGTFIVLQLFWSSNVLWWTCHDVYIFICLKSEHTYYIYIYVSTKNVCIYIYIDSVPQMKSFLSCNRLQRRWLLILNKTRHLLERKVSKCKLIEHIMFWVYFWTNDKTRRWKTHRISPRKTTKARFVKPTVFVWSSLPGWWLVNQF